MYERNAIVIDRYFSEMFGYGEKNNLKNNYKNYSELVLKLEEYQNISKEEDNIMIEFEKVANEIKDTQKAQESLYKKCLKFQETRQNLFDNLDESMETLQKKFSKIEDEIEKNNNDIKSNSEKFIEKIGEFNNKSEERTKCGRERRITENEYQKILAETTENFNGINQEKIESAKQFLKEENLKDLKSEIKNQIIKNGAKEKVPFNTNVIENAIDMATDLEKRRLEIFVATYEKTARLLNEIKNDSTKIERHQKFLKDADSKLKFLNMIGEYIISFLDNERMNVVGGEKEHKKLMDEACQNLSKDLEQIENLYDLLLKEISGKSTKKAYKEQYSPEYMQDLLRDEKNFEEKISKLNVIGTVIYPSYWRVEGMQKIYETFKNIVSDVYDKDLSEYEPLDISYEESVIPDIEEDEDDDFDWDDDYEEDDKEDEEIDDEDELEEDEDDSEDEDWEDEDLDDIEEEEDTEEEYEEEEEEDEEDEDDEDEEDRVIDEILGFYDDNSDDEDDDLQDIDFDDGESEEDDEDDDIDFDWDDDDLDDIELEDIEEEEEEEPKKKEKQ